jgi:hypothetical protein
MSIANTHQVGGSHYNKEYQHWDFVCDVKLHYLLACATKYVSRWRKKNGVEDLEKAIHYIEKAREKRVKGTNISNPEIRAKVIKFCNQHLNYDSEAIADICLANYVLSVRKIIKIKEKYNLDEKRK